MSDDTQTESEELPHLLVVDDSRLMRRAIGKILGKEYQITEAVDGEDAWTQIQSNSDFRVVFSDLSMPNLDGFGLLDRIRQSDDPAINELPVIIITGAEDDDETKHKALNNGASDFISKPFESVQLRTRAKTHVQLNQTHKKLNETTTELDKQATIDRLTGLSNKKYFDTHIVKDLSYAKRHRSELSLMLLEIHDFHKLFLKYGKEAADEILKHVSSISLSCIRNEDTISRIGLAKLAFILPSVNRIGTKRLAERVCEQIHELHVNIENSEVSITINVGVAAPDINNTTSLDDIISLAEKHLSIASDLPGNSIVTEETAFEEVTPKETKAEKQLRPLEQLPDTDTAIKLADSEKSELLQPYLVTLLTKILPLLKLCNQKLKLDIDDAIAKIEARLKT